MTDTCQNPNCDHFEEEIEADEDGYCPHCGSPAVPK